MAYIKQLQLNNEDICPLTHESAVVDSNGVSLSSKLGQLTLGIHTDGLMYLFINGEPIGQGFSFTGDIGDIDETTIYNIVNNYVEENKDNLKGDKGDQGIQGVKGDKGSDGLTTQIKVNGSTYTQSNGLITLPNYPSLTNYYNKSEVDTKIDDVVNRVIAELPIYNGEEV